MKSLLKRVAGHELIHKAYAAEYAAELCADNSRIVGIEGFLVINGSLLPQMDLIADFSTLTSSSDSLREAQRFVGLTAQDAREVYFSFSVVPPLN